FVHEIVVPFVRASGAATLATSPSTNAPPVGRRFHPGSEWLYAKLYLGTAIADAVLLEVVAPLIERLRDIGLLRRWFFIRYGDPDWHVRLRVQGERARLVSEAIPMLHEAAAPFLHDGRVRRMQLDTYEREVERYGGPDGIELAEALFEAD